MSSLIAVAKPQDTKTPKPLKEDAPSVRLATTPVTSTSVNPDNVSESVSYAGVGVATSANTPRPSIQSHSTGIGLVPQRQTVQQKRRVKSITAAKPVRATRVPPTASNHQKQKRGIVIGKTKDLQIKAIKRVANVFASRLEPSVSESSLKRHLETMLNLDVTVELCKLTNTHSSFHITCVCTDPKVFIEEDLWPEGTYVRWWRQPRQLKNSVGGPPSTTQVSVGQLVNTDTARLVQTLNCWWTAIHHTSVSRSASEH